MSEEQHGSEENGGIRINKFLASCGIDSRRVADRLIGEGRVEVNGKVIDTPGMRVTEKDFVKVDGRHMTPMEEVVVLLNMVALVNDFSRSNTQCKKGQRNQIVNSRSKVSIRNMLA